MSTFQLVGLDHTQFIPLFAQTDTELRAQGIARVLADAQPGYPCRISLEDAAVGEELLLLPFWHHRVDSPYMALGPIYIRKGATQTRMPLGAVPNYVTRRIMSLRAYDHEHLMIAADVCSGTEASAYIIGLFDDPAVSYIHLHNAKHGCFSCVANRASGR